MSTDILFVGDTPTKEDSVSALSGAELKLFSGLCQTAGLQVAPSFVTSWPHPLRKYYKEDSIVAASRDYLYSTLADLQPAVVVPLGGLPLYLLTGDQGIKDARGYLTMDRRSLYKILPTYHPRVLLADYSLRFSVIYDLRKALRHANRIEIRRPSRRVRLMESVDDVRQLFEELRRSASLVGQRGTELHDGSRVGGIGLGRVRADMGLGPNGLTVDIETHIDLQQISTISFSPSAQEANVIPILRKGAPGQDRSVWSPEDEVEILSLIALICALPTKKTFHNAIFDLSHLDHNGIWVTQVEDTMLMAHSQQPELQKSLGFLASISSEERQWKKMRIRTKDEEKSED